MIVIALRLALRGGRAALARFVFTAAGVATGVLLLVYALAALHGISAQDARSGWLGTSIHNHRPGVTSSRTDPLLWNKSSDEFLGQAITRIDVAGTGPGSPIPPGITALPTAGHYYASPALARLISRTDAGDLVGRFPGTQAGIIGRPALASPHVLIIVIGHAPAELATRPGTITVSSIETARVTHNVTTFQEVALSIGGVGLLFPILSFVMMSTRIGAAAREQRLAAMRLVGATMRQVSLIGAAEAASAALLGTLAALALFLLLRPALAGIRLTNDTWYPGDLTVGAGTAVGVVAGVTVAAGAVAASALRRVRLSPLGVTRRATPPPPNPQRLVLLGVGLLILGVFALAGRPYTRGASASYAPGIVGGFVFTMAGLVLAGPWLTMACTRVLAARAKRTAGLIANRRLADDPAAAFRAVSGLILAVFVGSVFVAGTATASSGKALGDDALAASTIVTEPLGGALSASDDAALTASLSAVSGVEAVTVAYTSPGGDLNGFPQVLVRCTDLAKTPEVGACSSAAQTATLPLYALDTGHTQPGTRWPAGTRGATELAGLGASALVIATDGRPLSVEAVRTAVERQLVGRMTEPRTVGQLSAANLRDVKQLQHLAYLAIILSVVIAGCSLTVAVAGSLIERRRPFAVLRLTGMPLRTLRRIVLLEAAVPLIGLTVVSAAGGLLTATLLLRAVRGTTLRLPGPGYYLMLLAGIAAAMVLVASTMPLLRRTSDPENLRYY